MPAFVNESSQGGIGLRGVQRQRMFGGDCDVGCAHQGVGAGGEHPENAVFAFRLLSLRRLIRKPNPHSVALANPVFLHQLDLFRPAGQRVQFCQQFLGVAGDRQVIHGNLTFFDDCAGAPAAPVNHLLISQHGLIHRVPVDHAGFQIGDAFFQHPQKQPLIPAVIIRDAGRHFAFPVHRKTEQAQLLLHVSDVVKRPLRRRDPTGHRCIFCRQAESIPAHRLQHVLAQHPLITGDHIANGVIADMAHVQPPAWIREHRQAIKFVAARFFAHSESPLGVPMILRFRFNALRMIRLGDHGNFPAGKRSALR